MDDDYYCSYEQAMMEAGEQKTAVIIAPDYLSIPGKGSEDMRNMIHTYLTDAGVFKKPIQKAQSV